MNGTEKVAVKIYSKIKLFDPMKKQNLNREIGVLRRMDHPNIIKLIKVIETKDNVENILFISR